MCKPLAGNLKRGSRELAAGRDLGTEFVRGRDRDRVRGWDGMGDMDGTKRARDHLLGRGNRAT